jgi:hypothetical protein
VARHFLASSVCVLYQRPAKLRIFPPGVGVGWPSVGMVEGVALPIEEAAGELRQAGRSAYLALTGNDVMHGKQLRLCMLWQSNT